MKDQNRESAAGVLGQQPVSGVDITVPITAQGRLSSASQFEEIVLRANPDGSLVRLRDVARVSLELLPIARKVVSMEVMQPFLESTCFLEPTLWKWRRT